MKLPDWQISKLADELVGTRGNPYEVAKHLFGVMIDNTVFEQLEIEGDIFRCVECNVWQCTDMQSYDGSSYCVDCDPDDEGS